MSQKESRAGQTRGTIEAVDSDGFPCFRIRNLREVAWGKIRWVFDLQLDFITLLDCRVIATAEGRPRFVSPLQLKDTHSQAYRAAVELDPNFKAEVFRAVVAAIEPAPASRTRAEDAGEASGSAWAMEQEAKLERAIAEMDGAA